MRETESNHTNNVDTTTSNDSRATSKEVSQIASNDSTEESSCGQDRDNLLCRCEFSNSICAIIGFTYQRVVASTECPIGWIGTSDDTNEKR